MSLIFLPQALEEIEKASLYYECQEDGLGGEFAKEVYTFARMIAMAPEQPRIRRRGYRRVNLERFPYYIAYSIEAGLIVVLAIGHSARLPEYWIDRKG
jgi:hypothetical protein